jgi:hypothetical protein
MSFSNFTDSLNNNVKPFMQHLVPAVQKIYINETDRKVTIRTTRKPKLRKEAMGDGPKED